MSDYAYTPEQVAAARSLAIETLAKGTDVRGTVAQLKHSFVGDGIKEMLSDGLSDDTILSSIIGAEDYAKLVDAKKAGSVTTFGKGMADAAGDMYYGARRTGNMIQGDDAELAQIEQKIAERESDTARQVRDNRTAAQVGQFTAKAAPNIVAAALTGGASLPAQTAIQAGVGGLTGLTETHGDPLKNATINAGLSGLAVPGANAVGALGSKVLSKTAEKAATRAANLEAKAAQGDALAANRQAFSKSVAEKIGLKDYDGPIDSTMVRTAETQAKELFEAASKGRAVQVPKGFTNFIKQTAEDHLEEVGKAVTRLANLRNGTFVPAKKWIEMRSKLASLARDAKGSDAHYIGQMVEKMDDALGAGRAAEQVQKLNQGREIWRNLQPVKDMVKKSGDTGEVTWQHFKTAVSRDTDKFARGQAPLQDLAPLAEKLQPQGKLLNKLDELKGGVGSTAAKAAGSLLLDAIPFGNTLAKATNVANNPNVLRGIANISQKGASALENKAARQALAQLVTKGLGNSGGGR